MYAESGKVHAQYFDFSLPLRGVAEDTPMWTGPAVFQLLRHEGLLDAVESLIGPEIYSNPVQHVRLKPPSTCDRAHLEWKIAHLQHVLDTEIPTYRIALDLTPQHR